MRKKVLVGLVCAFALCMSFVLAGCGEDNKEPEALQITDSGWYLNEIKNDDSGFVHYGVSVYNPNDTYSAEYFTVSATGKDEDGNILFNDDQVMYVIKPGETVTFGMQAGNGKKPSTVDFSVRVKDSNWEKVKKDSETIPAYDVSDTNCSTMSVLNNTDFTGKIKVDEPWNNKDAALMSVILKDESGNIIAGYNTFVDIVKGEYVPFDISVNRCPEFSSYEIYAVPW